MELKAIILCFAFFVMTVSGASVSNTEADEPKKDTVSKYTVEVDDGKKKVDETVEIDTEKETETFHIPSDGDTSPSSPGDVDIVYDFKKNMAMQRMSNPNACFLGNSTDSLPKPNDLQKILDDGSPLQSNTPQRTEYTVVGVLTDRSFLSDEMVELCKRVSIYLVKEESLLENAEKQKHRLTQRRKRSWRRWRCRYICVWFCYAPGCCSWRYQWWCDYYYYNYYNYYFAY